jgi:glycosyltransferase involved in cell wall biosynthesis
MNELTKAIEWNVISHIDEFSDGVLRGWAHTASNESLELHLEVDGQEVLAFKADDYRKDLKAAGKVEGMCSFNLDYSKYIKTNKTCQVCLVAKNDGQRKVIFSEGILTAANPSAVETPQQEFKGYLQKIESDAIKGWVSFGDTSKPISLDVSIDNVFVGKTLSNETREDLIKAGVLGKHSSFSYKIPQKYYDSKKHSVSISPTGVDGLIPGSPKDFFLKKSAIVSKTKSESDTAKKKPEAGSGIKYRGRVDKLKNGRIICGWATDGISKNIALEVLIDGKLIGEAVAGSFRGDLKDANINNGNAAFELMPPANMFDGKKHIISIRDKSNGEVIATRKDVELKNDRNYKDFHEYLKWSFFNKEVFAPFTEEDKRCLSYMDWYVKRENLKKDALVEKPLVSIVMPTYKRASVILKAVNSVLNQSYTNWELVIVDDGGKDNTGDVLSKLNDDRIKYFELPKNQGVSFARNKALELSTGEFVCYLDSDNTWHEDFLLIMSLALIENKEFESAYCAQYLFRSTSDKPYAMRYGMFNKTLLKNRNYIDMNCLMHRHSLYESKGGFDTSLRRLVDWDLLLRYTEDSAPLTVPAVLSNYYFNEGEETITVSESLDDALKGLLDKDLKANQIDILDHAEISFNSDDGSSESMLTGVPYYSKVTNKKSALTKRLKQRRKSAIVVISFNIPGIFRKCLDSMISTVDLSKTEIIIVDNLSNDETIELLHEYNDRYPQIKIKLNDYNYGFTHAVNQGIEMADDDADIVLINNDSIATPGWLNAMEDVIINNPDVGIVAPQQVLLPNTRTMNQHSPFANPNNELDVTISYHHDNLVKVKQTASHLVDVHFIPFFCVYIPRETINAVGVLDAELGRHYRSDRLYCNAVIQYAKKRIVFTPDSKLYHLHQQSTSSLKKKDNSEYKEMFTDNKWVGHDLYKTPIWEE